MSVNRPFADCKIADLHLADAIQPFGALLAIDGDDRVIAVSANAADLLGEPPQRLLGTHARETLASALDLDAARSEAASGPAIPVRLQLRTVKVRGRSLAAAVHVADDVVIAEYQEIADDDPQADDVAGIVQRVAEALAETETAEDAGRRLLDGVAELTGFDRSLFYRFLPGWHGEVVDERLNGTLEGFKGLRFPESDLPANARRLYLAKRQRIIADVQSATVPVLGIEDGMHLDLTGSETRAVHPTHLEYLTNMGVGASFSVSIVANRTLWGMIACHHAAPRRLPFAVRQACELLATVTSLHIADLERIERMLAATRHSIARERVRFEIEQAGLDRLDASLSRIRQAFDADGAWARVGRVACEDGVVPAGDAARRLRAWCDTVASDRPTAVDAVPMDLADDAEIVRTASGVLHVPLGREGFVTLLRSEQVEHVAWAGRPPDDAEADSGALGPRTSFLTWRAEVSGRAVPWTASDLDAAVALREMLLEAVDHVELERKAVTDELTGLGNRRVFDEALREVLIEDRRSRGGLLLVDLDRFKPVNDRYGHPVGDRLLQEVARRMWATVRDGDVVARLGGDEFAVVLRNAADRDAVAAMAERMIEALEAPYVVDGIELVIGASIGATIAKRNDAPDTMVERADDALYASKRAGRGGFVVAETPSSDR